MIHKRVITAGGVVGGAGAAARGRPDIQRSARSANRWLRLLCTAGCGFTAAPLHADHQTLGFSPVYGSGNLPFSIRIEQVNLNSAPLPTLHSYIAAQWKGQWLFLGGRTNGLHGMMGMGAFPTAYANTDAWVVDRAGQRTWHRSLNDTGLNNGTVDFLSATNHNFVQEDARLYVAGGYGFDRAAADYVTFSHFAAIDVPGLMDWVKQIPGTPAPAASIRTIQSPLFQVTGGALEKTGDRFLLIFGQNYPGRYRPLFNGTYTRQVRRFSMLAGIEGPVLDPASVYQSPPADDFRRRDLNVVPVLRRDAASGALVDEVLALAGVFTPTNGVWTVPVTITSNGVPSQPDPLAGTTFKQGLHHYHSAKASLFDRVTGDNFVLQFGGLSAQFRDTMTATWISDPQVPFVRHISCLVRSATGDFHQTLLPAEFPGIRSAEGVPLFFGTNAEFLPAPGVPLLRPGIIDLISLHGPQVIGYIYGGLVSDAPNSGNTRAAAETFAVILESAPAPGPALSIARTEPDGICLSWPVESGVRYLFEQSSGLASWTELWPPPPVSPLNLPTGSVPRNFFRLHGRTPAIPSP